MVVQISWFKKSCWKWQTFCLKLSNQLHPENSTCGKARSYPVLKSSFGARSSLRAATSPVFQSSELSHIFLICCTKPHPLPLEIFFNFFPIQNSTLFLVRRSLKHLCDIMSLCTHYTAKLHVFHSCNAAFCMSPYSSLFPLNYLQHSIPFWFQKSDSVWVGSSFLQPGTFCTDLFL